MRLSRHRRRLATKAAAGLLSEDYLKRYTSFRERLETPVRTCPSSGPSLKTTVSHIEPPWATDLKRDDNV